MSFDSGNLAVNSNLFVLNLAPSMLFTGGGDIQMKKIVLFGLRFVFGVATLGCLFVTLFSVVTLSPMLAPAVVALFTLGICNIPLYFSPALSPNADAEAVTFTNSARKSTFARAA